MGKIDRHVARDQGVDELLAFARERLGVVAIGVEIEGMPAPQQVGDGWMGQ